MSIPCPTLASFRSTLKVRGSGRSRHREDSLISTAHGSRSFDALVVVGPMRSTDNREVVARVSSGRFIGRRSELDRLRSALTQSRSAETSVFLIGGEAGVGKTRLVEEAAKVARASGHTVLVGGCLNVSEDAAPLAPFVEAMRTLASALSPTQLDEVIGPANEAIGLILPDTGVGLRHAPAAPATTQARLFEHLLGILTRLSAHNPALVVIEDIHWADRSTLDLLRFLARNLRLVSVVIVATYRTDEPGPGAQLGDLLAEFERSGRVERFELGSFNRAELAGQLHGILGSPASSDLVERIYRLSDGNAFHAEELVAAEAGGHGMPETLEQVLLARVDGVSGAGRALLRTASVTGGQTTEQLLVAVAEQDEGTVRQSLRDLLERKLLVRRKRGTTETIEFRHALLQEVVYGQLLPVERVRLHEACAHSLERQLRNPPDLGLLTELARHWSEVGDADQALRASVRAGIAADEAHAPSEAAVQYERALGLWTSAPTAVAEIGLDHIDLLERAARAESGMSSARAIDHINEAIMLVDPIGAAVRSGLLHERLGRYRWINGDGAGAMAAYLEAMRLVPAHPPTTARARVTASLGQILMILARFEDSVPLCEEALAAARAAGARDVEAHALNTLGQDVAYLGEVDRGLAMLQQSLALAREIGSAEDAARAYVNILDTLKVSARFDDAIGLAQEAFDYSHGHGMTAVYGIGALTYGAWAAYRCGRWAESARLLDSARLHPADGKDELEILLFSAFLQVGSGAFELARSGLDRARDLLEGAIDTQDIAPYTEARAELALWTGEPAAAAREVAEGIERAEPPIGANISRIGPLYALGVRAAADRLAAGRVGVGPEAPEALRRDGRRYLTLMAGAHAQISSRWPAHSSLSLPYLRLCEAESTRLGRADPDAWNAAADALAGLELRYLIAYARWRHGQAILALRHGKAAAREPLRDAALIALELGAGPLHAAIVRVAERAGLELSAAPAADAGPARRFGLTRRELEVLRLLVDGRTNRQIAGELFISEKTAGTHVSSILGKLDVASRTEAASLAHRVGLVDL
jgi:DNA-binding CsgD family transcriptional regulator/tetratricopeptide (TPR) repeat protein